MRSPWIVAAITTSLVSLGATFACHAEAPKTPPAKAQAAAVTKQYVKPAPAELKKRLTPLQYEVTQEDGTEPPFRNAYWDNKADGIYVDVVTGEPLFSSKDKYKSGTGWPSFTRPLSDKHVWTREDNSLFSSRTEVRSTVANSHLGHVFNDGPAPTGQRWCMNSAAMRFVPAADLIKEGYAEYAADFGIKVPASAAPAATSATVTKATTATPKTETAILAGGCFWGMEEILRGVPGIVHTEVGYAGGKVKNPTYSVVSGGDSGHAESVKIVFDPAKISFAEILEEWFFRMHDPTTKNRQGNDIGTQYRSAIFCADAAQCDAARKVIAKVDAAKTWDKPIVTEVVPAGPFTAAESYHQDYLQKNPNGYTCHYLRD